MRPTPVAEPLPRPGGSTGPRVGWLERLVSLAITVGAIAAIVALARGWSPYAAPTAAGTRERVAAVAVIASRADPRVSARTDRPSQTTARSRWQ